MGLATHEVWSSNSAGSFLEIQNLRPHPDLLNQNLYLARPPGNLTWGRALSPFSTISRNLQTRFRTANL